MIQLLPNISVEWIYTQRGEFGKATIAAYPNLSQDMAEIYERLDRYSKSPTPQHMLLLEKATEQFSNRSLKAFGLDWKRLREEFSTDDPQLSDIKRLFAEETIENRALVLLKIWKKIAEKSEFVIRD